MHINNCFKEGELNKGSVVRDFLTTVSDPHSKDIMTTMVMNFLSVG